MPLIAFLFKITDVTKNKLKFLLRLSFAEMNIISFALETNSANSI